MSYYRTLLAVGGYSPELKAVIARATLEGFTLPTVDTLKKLDVLIRYMVTEGVFSVLDYLRISALNDVACENFARINFARPSGTLITYVLGGTSTISYTVNGVKLNSTTSNYAHLNSGVDIIMPTSSNFYKRASAFRATVLYQAATGGFTNMINGVGGPVVERMQNANTVGQRIAQGTANLATSIDFSGTGIKALSRNSPTIVTGISKDVVSTSTANHDASTLNYGTYAEGRSGNLGSNMGTSAGLLGGYLTDTQVLNFRTAYNNYLLAIGLTDHA